MSIIKRPQSGFTFIETLMALILVSSILLPTSFWLYRSHTSQAAWEHFRATQLLEINMNRAFVLQQNKDAFVEIPGPNYLRLEIHAQKDGEEIRLFGKAYNRKGRVIVQLQTAFFQENHL